MPPVVPRMRSISGSISVTTASRSSLIWRFWEALGDTLVQFADEGWFDLAHVCGRPDFFFRNHPLVPVVIAPDPIAPFVTNQREELEDGVAPGRKSGRRWEDGLTDFEAMVWH